MKLLETTLNIVKSRGEQLFLDTSRTYAYTLLAKFGDEKYFVRVSPDVEQIDNASLKDLKILSQFTNTSAICIVSSIRGRILQRGLFYLKNNVAFVSLATFIDILDNRPPAFRLSRGVIIAAVDGKKLREKREESRMSLSALASRLGVSRETVYRYEREEVEAPIKVAQKLVSMFGDEVIKKLEINKPEVSPEEIRSREVDAGVYRLVESHPDAVRAEEKVLFISTNAEKYEKTVELANALGIEVERSG
ncbi:MAG: helix-turn-helix domain-containing protein [Pyrobaculum sp.]